MLLRTRGLSVLLLHLAVVVLMEARPLGRLFTSVIGSEVLIFLAPRCEYSTCDAIVLEGFFLRTLLGTNLPNPPCCLRVG